MPPFIPESLVFTHSMPFSSGRRPPVFFHHEPDGQQIAGGYNAQRALWDRQHKLTVSRVEQEYGPRRDQPSPTGIRFVGGLQPNSLILEIGPGTFGRDSRYFANQGHRVIAADISSVALEEINQLISSTPIQDRIHTIRHDISGGNLPDLQGQKLDGFFARASLNITDAALLRLAKTLTTIMSPGGLIVIEGRSSHDDRIKRSKPTPDQHIFIDFERNEEGGHLRRGWTEGSIMQMVDVGGWNLIEVVTVHTKRPDITIENITLMARTPKAAI